MKHRNCCLSYSSAEIFSFFFLPFFMCLPNCYKTYALLLRKNNISQAEVSIHDQNAMAFIIFQFAYKWLIES